jgi:hypothetical protein
LCACCDDGDGTEREMLKGLTFLECEEDGLDLGDRFPRIAVLSDPSAATASHTSALATTKDRLA